MLIGCGGMARTHAGMFRTLSGRMKRSARVDTDREKAGRIAGLLPERPPVISDYRGALPHCRAMFHAQSRHPHSFTADVCLKSGNGPAACPFGKSRMHGTKMKRFFQPCGEKGLLASPIPEGKRCFRNEPAPRNPGFPEPPESGKHVLLPLGEKGIFSPMCREHNKQNQENRPREIQNAKTGRQKKTHY